MSQAGAINSGGSGPFSLSLTGNSGGAVHPTLGNINVVGSGLISIVGNPGTSTMTVSYGGTGGTHTYHTDSGDAVESGNAITIAGGSNINTVGSGATVTVNLDSNVSIDTLALTNPLTVPNGGTGANAFTAYSVICAGTIATGAFQNVSGVGSAGQVLTSNGAAALPTWQATAIAFTWSEQTGTTVAMAVNNGYIANNGALVTLTLPATAALGSIIEVSGKGVGGWSIAQNAGQTIHFGASNTTTGVGGSLSSTLQYDTVRMVCTTADTDFVVLSSVGNLTVV